MSFFGFENKDLKQDKIDFKNSPSFGSEDVAVYTWGEEGYDGLGDLLQEGRDELNDETFGVDVEVGKDFDFSTPALPDHSSPAQEAKKSAKQETMSTNEISPIRSVHPSRPTTNSLESIWDEKSPFSVLPRTNGPGRSGFDDLQRSPLVTSSSVQLGRTLQEIEAEMRVAAQQARLRSQLEQQQEVQQQQEEAMRLSQLQRERERQQRQEREFERRQVLQFQDQQHQLQIQRALLQQHQEQQHYQHTPPPRMLPGISQSPRFLEHQRQILLLQQQQEQQQQQRLQELQEQLRYEELERQMITKIQSQQANGSGYLSHSRQQSGPIAIETSTTQQHFQQQHRRQRSQTPIGNHFPLQESMPYLPQNIQLQQRLLSELAQAEFLRDMQGVNNQAEQEALRNEAMRKIVETEKMEEKRRKKAAKIAHMARYNDLMTQSDKDFITRIQVSQLVTQDPYADDFYAQVYGAILRSRMGIQAQDERVLKFTSGGGVGLGINQKGGNRRPNAMLRMEQQVERIVNNARKREEEKGLHSFHNLQGALGKTSGRSYKAAPRQLLQVDMSNPHTSSAALPTRERTPESVSKSSKEGAVYEAAKLGREVLGNAGDTDGLVRKDPLTHRQILVAVEELYDFVLNTENLKRNEPTHDDSDEHVHQWKKEYEASVDKLWAGLKVMVPLETSNPHPFISLLMPSKGKKILPRATRHLSHERMYTLLTLLVACFDQLDVVQNAHLLDMLEDSKEHAEVERQSEAFLIGVLHSILPIVAKAELKVVIGLLGLLLDRTNILKVAQSGAGIALLTLFLSRVEVMKQAIASGIELLETPTPEEAQQWQLMFDHLFQLLAPHLPSLFPSTRIAANMLPGQTKPIDQADQPVWQLLAAIALHAVTEQQRILVATLRDKILENVMRINKGLVATEDERQTKLANVNLFLHALGLDSSQITV